MEYTRIALVLLFALWSVQIYAGWRQWRHLQRSIAQEARTQTDGYLGIGQSRPRFGFGRIVMLLVDADLRVRRLRLMGGVTVFARFRDLAGHEGASLDALRASMAQPGTPKPLAAAVQAAVEQVELARSRRAAT